MPSNTANEFYEKLVDGTDYHKKITLETSEGYTLEGVEVHTVNKQVLARVIEKLPEDMFEAVDDADNPDEAEEQLEEAGMSVSAVTGETIDGFEELVSESLVHEDLTNTQIEQIVENLSFETLFEIGSEIIDISFDQSGDIKDFHEKA